MPPEYYFCPHGIPVISQPPQLALFQLEGAAVALWALLVSELLALSMSVKLILAVCICSLVLLVPTRSSQEHRMADKLRSLLWGSVPSPQQTNTCSNPSVNFMLLWAVTCEHGPCNWAATPPPAGGSFQAGNHGLWFDSADPHHSCFTLRRTMKPATPHRLKKTKRKSASVQFYS